MTRSRQARLPQRLQQPSTPACTCKQSTCTCASYMQVPRTQAPEQLSALSIEWVERLRSILAGVLQVADTGVVAKQASRTSEGCSSDSSTLHCGRHKKQKHDWRETVTETRTGSRQRSEKLQDQHRPSWDSAGSAVVTRCTTLSSTVDRNVLGLTSTGRKHS